MSASDEEEGKMALPKKQETVKPPVDIQRKKMIYKLLKEVCDRNEGALRRLAKH